MTRPNYYRYKTHKLTFFMTYLEGMLIPYFNGNYYMTVAIPNYFILYAFGHDVFQLAIQYKNRKRIVY